MLKKLSYEGRFELGIEEKFAGKVYAYTAVIDKDYGSALGIAVANEPGYCPINGYWAHSDNYTEMSRHADELNAELGLSLKQAAIIVCSTLRNPK